jgi:NCAIR mutase (PurE)-related protein
LRNGLPEVVFCQGKTSEQIAEIIRTLSLHHSRVLGTRATPEQAEFVTRQLPEVRYDPTARLLRYEKEAPPVTGGHRYILVATGGTSDIPVAEEAAQTAEFFGNRVIRAYDVGVAGIHRLLDLGKTLFEADVVIAVAGMEGALASVIGGLVACPVIAVPTSVGYGANFGGVAALLAMLNSCATGVAVVNIDNGFGAAAFAHAILNPIGKR